jgi:hypothetical protein
MSEATMSMPGRGFSMFSNQCERLILFALKKGWEREREEEEVAIHQIERKDRVM